MRWIISSRKETAIIQGDDESVWIPEFNTPFLDGNGGGTCIAEPEAVVETRNAANEDIAQGNVKRFESVDDMLESLKHPW